MGKKPKVGIYWAASCGGCDVALLDFNEKIFEVVDAVDIVFWPIAMDVKYSDLLDMRDDYIDVTFFNGSIRSSENERFAKILRKKSKLLVAFGSCACNGGIPGLANLASKKELFETVYINNETTPNPTKVVPQVKSAFGEETLTLPEIYDRVRSLDQVIDVDYFVPGCPPSADRIEEVFNAFISGKLPSKGTVFASDKSLCDECPRERKDKKITKIHRIHEIVDNGECLLDQGILCMGPVTRGGCGAECILANMPCTGCYGPLSDIKDQGTAMLSAIASVISTEETRQLSEEEEKEIMEAIKDCIGIFYKYSLPSSIFGGKVKSLADRRGDKHGEKK
jgi:F420-non-reducing hydrogenase small subunit